ncbi:hypothetical protein AB0L70_35980 [Kribbella sp. NPDC051952]|uniref:hypothetical protein n=1 Tax=Kribbella sp. NPDC051952 TaxID=3154851 RepID=UPI0034269CBE
MSMNLLVRGRTGSAVRFALSCSVKITQILDGWSALTRLSGQVGVLEGIFEGAGAGGIRGLAA